MLAGAKSLPQELLCWLGLWPFEIPLKVTHADQVLELLRGFVLASKYIVEY